MDKNLQKVSRKRQKRKLRVSSKVRGSASKPRIAVYKSNRYVFVQCIDDEKGMTLFSVGSYTKSLKTDENVSLKSKEIARKIGQAIGEKALERNISSAVFDRGRFKYHGVVAEIATGARDAGLQI